MPDQSTQNITIAIDGFSACGKSTLAKDLAKSLNYIYIDSGSMYRAVTLYALEQGIDLDVLESKLDEVKIHFENIDDHSHIFLNGKDVSLDIRSKAVNDHVSLVAKIPPVRRFLVKQQQAFGANKGIVMDGRDIGTVVFPEAELKFFIEADIAIRTKRRATEMAEIGKSLPADTIEQNLIERDRIDSTRADSPLYKADDAIAIDNSNLSKVEQLNLCLKYVEAFRSKGIIS